jgi:hypothetical protein
MHQWSPHLLQQGGYYESDASDELGVPAQESYHNNHYDPVHDHYDPVHDVHWPTIEDLYEAAAMTSLFSFATESSSTEAWPSDHELNTENSPMIILLSAPRCLGIIRPGTFQWT